MGKRRCFFRNIALASLILSLILSGSAQAAPLCENVFGNSLSQESLQGKRGSDLGPIEWLRFFKQKIAPSKIIRNFDQNKYEIALKNIKENNLEVEAGFRPRDLEESIAYLDVKLEEMSISVVQMPTILKHKVYTRVQKILQEQGKGADLAGADLANIIFRGNYQKPTSFAYLLTHTPNAAKIEMFVQHLHALAVTDIVSKAYEYNPGPQRPTFLARHSPEFVRKNKEALIWTMWMGVSIATGIKQHALGALFLPDLNIFKTHRSRVKIDETRVNTSLDEALVELTPEMKEKETINYYYSIGVKAMNWYVLGLLVVDLF